MIPQFVTSPHSAESISPGSQQTIETYRTSDRSVADLFGLGFVIVIAILVSRQLVINFYQQYLLHRTAVLLQRRATLERQLHWKSSVPAFKRRLL